MDPQKNRDRAAEASIRNFFSTSNLEMTVTQIDKNLLCRADGYQRTTSSKVVNTIVKFYNPLLFRPLTVSLRPDGRYIVVDGEHRRQVAMAMSSLLAVPCIVHIGLSFREEAECRVPPRGHRSRLGHPPGREISRCKSEQIYQSKSERTTIDCCNTRSRCCHPSLSQTGFPPMHP